MVNSELAAKKWKWVDNALELLAANGQDAGSSCVVRMSLKSER